MVTLFDRSSFYYTQCVSTNDIAYAYLLKNRVAEGTIFIADYQSGGKGQRGSKWESFPAQNLLFSLIIYPRYLSADDSFSLTILTTLSLYSVLEKYIPGAITIKWPNDIYCENRKVSGILIQTQIGENEKIIKSAIIGIGLNVNQLKFESSHATSLALCTQTKWDRNLIFTQVLNAMGDYYAQLQDGRIEALRFSYANKLYHKKGFHDFKTIDGPIEGRIVEVNRLGQLVIEDRIGNCYKYYPKEIVFIF